MSLYDSAGIAMWDENEILLHQFDRDFNDCYEWEQLGNAIGRCTNVGELKLFMDAVLDEDDYMDIDSRSRQCIGAFYRGLETNSSIESLELDMGLFPDGNGLPIFNIAEAQSKESLIDLTIQSWHPITIRQSIFVSSLLENTYLESFVIGNCTIDDESAFRRIIQACLKVESLEVKCSTTSQFAIVAALLRNAVSVLNELHLYGSITDEGLSTITASLSDNTVLKKLSTNYRRGKGVASIEKLLCDASSIYKIYNSNHTLNTIFNTRVGRMCSRLPLQICDCLELNKNTNKNAVIHKKIARYYFVGDFDVSPFITHHHAYITSLESAGYD